MTATMEQLVSELAEARIEKAKASAAIAAIEEDHAPMYDARTAAIAAVRNATDAIIKAGLNAEHPALTIKTEKVIDFLLNDEQLTQWCFKWMAYTLKPDKKLLEKAARNGLPFPKEIIKGKPQDIIRIIEQPKVTIASDLSAYLNKPVSTDAGEAPEPEVADESTVAGAAHEDSHAKR